MNNWPFQRNQNSLRLLLSSIMFILLDIDGVLLPAKPWVSLPLLDDKFYDFNSKSVEVLNQIIDKTSAKIILTTSHKHSFSLYQWVKIFNNRGLNISSIDRLFSNDTILSRREEIENWYSIQKTEINFVIIDDDKSLNELPLLLKDRLILTNSLVGLTENHLEEAIRILND